MKNVGILLFIIILFRKISTNNNLRLNIEEKTDEKKKIVVVETGQCEFQECGLTFCAVSPRGSCEKINNEGDINSYCKCNSGYTTSTSKPYYQCCYTQKKYLVAFFLEFFVGFGAGHFYTGNFNSGLFKLVVYVVMLLLSIIILCYDKKNKRLLISFHFHTLKVAILLSTACVYVGWQIIDSVLFCSGGYKDGNNIELS